MINPDYFNIYECTITMMDLDTGKVVFHDTINAPRIVHEKQFINIIRQVCNEKRHIQVTLSREMYVAGRNEPLVLYIAYQNN